MPRPSDCALALGLAAGLCAGPECTDRARPPQVLEVGHHRLQLVVPPGWEHLDHGRQHLFRSGERQVSLVDVGVATPEGLSAELRDAEALWQAGRQEEALARVRDLRSYRLELLPAARTGEFWRPWTDATDSPGPPDHAAIGPAFTALIDAAAGLEAAPPMQRVDAVLAGSMDVRRREVAHRTEREIHGSAWIEVETWDRVSHLHRSRLACTENGGYLLALAIDRSAPGQADAVFEALLASIQVAPVRP